MKGRMKIVWTAALSAAVVVLACLGLAAALSAPEPLSANGLVQVSVRVTDEAGKYSAAFTGTADSVWDAGGARLSEQNRYLEYTVTVTNGERRDVSVSVLPEAPKAIRVTSEFPGGGEVLLIPAGETARFTVRLAVTDFSASFSGPCGFTLDIF